MNVWVYYIYWSEKYPKNPDDPICSYKRFDSSAVPGNKSFSKVQLNGTSDLISSYN